MPDIERLLPIDFDAALMLDSAYYIKSGGIASRFLIRTYAAYLHDIDREPSFICAPSGAFAEKDHQHYMQRNAACAALRKDTSHFRHLSFFFMIHYPLVSLLLW